MSCNNNNNNSSLEVAVHSRYSPYKNRHSCLFSPQCLPELNWGCPDL